MGFVNRVGVTGRGDFLVAAPYADGVGDSLYHFVEFDFDAGQRIAVRMVARRERLCLIDRAQIAGVTVRLAQVGDQHGGPRLRRGERERGEDQREGRERGAPEPAAGRHAGLRCPPPTLGGRGERVAPTSADRKPNSRFNIVLPTCAVTAIGFL